MGDMFYVKRIENLANGTKAYKRGSTRLCLLDENASNHKLKKGDVSKAIIVKGGIRYDIIRLIPGTQKHSKKRFNYTKMLHESKKILDHSTSKGHTIESMNDEYNKCHKLEKRLIKKIKKLARQTAILK